MPDTPSTKLIVSREHHAPGEYAFTPTTLALSVSLSRCKVEMRFDGRVWEGNSARGDIKVMPVGQERIFRHREACRFAFIGIDDLALSTDGMAGSVRQPHAALRDRPLQHVVDALLTESAMGPTSALFQDAVAMAIVARLHDLDGNVPRRLPHCLPSAALSKVLDFLDTHLAEDVSVADLASVAGLSPAHFSTLFRNTTGEPPHRYHTRLRVERARLLLKSGVKPPDAALRVGFCDQSHLARHMRRLLGMSPGMRRGRRSL